MSTPAPHRIDVHHHVLPLENNDLQQTVQGRRDEPKTLKCVSFSLMPPFPPKGRFAKAKRYIWRDVYKPWYFARIDNA